MSLDKLDYVLALAEERNLTRAARKAFISQPTLTNYINRLEEQLGVKLFDRSVTPIEITRAGALFERTLPADRNALPSAPSSSRSIPALRRQLTVRKIPGLPSAGRPLP